MKNCERWMILMAAAMLTALATLMASVAHAQPVVGGSGRTAPPSRERLDSGRAPGRGASGEIVMPVRGTVTTIKTINGCSTRAIISGSPGTVRTLRPDDLGRSPWRQLFGLRID